MGHMAFYGNVAIARGFCPDCERQAFIIDRELQCCGKPTDEEIEGAQRICEPEDRKVSPTRTQKQKILKRQHDRCLYCDRRFNSHVWYKGKLITLRTNYDHVLPFEYSRDNSLGNFVACCHVCNSWKGTKLFTHLEEIQVYVAAKWERVGTDVGKILHGVQENIPE